MAWAGYASTAPNPEPYAYQSAFAVKWLIEEQAQGDPELSVEAGRAPWLAWGPYLWADGTRARSDGLLWACADFQDDGTHPAAPAREKVATLLLDFLKTDPTARPWFARAAPQPPPAARAAALVNAASFQAGVAARSIATIFGENLAAAETWAGSVPLPSALGGASVELDGVFCPLLYVSPDQSNLVIPAGAQYTTSGSLVVIRDGARSPPMPVTLVDAAPALFAREPMGAAAAQHADFRAVSTEAPARRGETILLYATGLGALDPATLAKTNPAPVVRIGGIEARIAYAGAAPGFAGLDQINLEVPYGAPPGATVRVDLFVGTASAAPVTLAIAP